MTRAAELTLAISDEWEQLAELVGDDLEPVEYDLITLLRRLEKEAENTAELVKAIISLFVPHPAAHHLLLQAISRATPGTAKGAMMSAELVKKDRFTLVPVFYGTDRARTAGTSNVSTYGPARGELACGIAEISIPDDHRMGEIERPRWWKLQFRENTAKHVVLQSAVEIPLTDFESQAKIMLGRSAKKEILLFVHGYNVTFEDAVKRTAQIAYDLQFEGLATLYSWPSEGSTPMYTVDEGNVTWSRPRFAQFVGLLRDRVGAEVVHVLAHSMGSRLVAETMASFSSLAEPKSARIRQLVYAAPDIDAATFKDLAATFGKNAERVTMYASSGDFALKASKLIHRYARAGESGLDLVVMDAIDTVDASAVDTSLLGHSYYGDNRSILADMFELIRRGSPPQERFSLSPKDRYGSRYWLFKA